MLKFNTALMKINTKKRCNVIQLNIHSNKCVCKYYMLMPISSFICILDTRYEFFTTSWNNRRKESDGSERDGAPSKAKSDSVIVSTRQSGCLISLSEM